MNVSSAIRVLMIGGAADGMRVTLPARQNSFRYVHHDVLSVYAVHTVLGAFGEVFYVGVQNLNDCPLCALVAGYQRPRPHNSEGPVAETMVTFLEGSADGRQMLVPDTCKAISPNGVAGSLYHIVPVICKDGRQFRVGILDPICTDPIKVLYEGYRK